jgi:tetratricopeptide (TPR) repeat protein
VIDGLPKGERSPSGKYSILKPGAVRCEIDGVPRPVQLDDVNAAGVFVACDDPPPADSEVRVHLELGALRLEMGGHVVQVVSTARAKQENRRRGFGFLFTHMDETQRAALRQAIDAAHAALRNASERAAAQLAEERKLLAKLQGQLRELPSAPWSVLGVPQDADFETAQRAFFTASKRYHPHLFSRYELPEIKTTVTELFIAHKRAFSVFDKARQRSAARATGSGFNGPLANASASGSPASTGGSQRPKDARATPAHGLARPLASLRPEAPISRAAELERLLSTGVKCLAQNRFDEAESALTRALELDHDSENARVWLLITQARRAKAGGDVLYAVERYFEVLTLDPKHHEALAETKKHAKDAPGKGLLGRLFGSGDK